MSNSNRYKSHSGGSNRNIHEPVQTVLHHVEEQGLGNAATNPPRSDELLAHPGKIKKLNEYHAKKREASKEEAPVPSQPTSPRGEEE
ncbi:hypothetical protein O181_009535 [Austropuccinia psidii MF-1]|uniref:Uncharacterized protein n=1 Tax=Austropuccinia psidii MF-1 TaxID=1389203 RepID=A0A9Q3BRH0_9BASI|nr:hypothetical protein [Austropuccinia psidii MF-1]